MNATKMKKIVTSFVEQMQEYLDLDMVLFIGEFASNFCISEHKKRGKATTQDVGRFRRKSSSFLIWEANTPRCLDSLDEKYNFDFVFSDDIGSFYSNASRMQNLEIAGSNHKISPGWGDIFDQVKLLNKNGILVLLMDSRALITKEYRLLNDIGFYVNAVFGLPYIERLSRGNTREELSIFVISKENNSSLFVADLEEGNTNYTSIIKNFFKKENGVNLYTGYRVKNKEFRTFSVVRAKAQVKDLTAHYKKYKMISINELLDDREQNFNDYSIRSENYIFILNRRDSILRALPVATISRSHIDEQYYRYYFHVSFNEVIRGEYVAIFLQSQLGGSLYKIYSSDGIFGHYTLSENNLRNLSIFIPPLDIQDQIIRAHNKIVDLQDSINTFSDNLSLNPNQFISESIGKIDDMLDQVGKLNATDKIRQIIERGECVDVEFKQTFGLETNSKNPKYGKSNDALKERIFEQISAFLNSYGGVLLIGVHDDQHITGMAKELRVLYGKSHDKFKLRFHEEISKYLGKEFTSPDYITYGFVPIDNYEVFKINCKRSTIPCRFGKEERLIVQEDPRIKTLKGEAEMRYISKHFPEYYASHFHL